ncbi:16S rRNA methyltransferase [Chloroflexota bacterium]
MSSLDDLVANVAASKKYKSVCTDTVYRIGALELSAHSGSIKAASKATKQRLHQIYGAFERQADYGQANDWLRSAFQGDSAYEIEAACRRILSWHSSTRERLPFLDHFYSEIFRLTGQPHSVLDLGCGLNPLALPWMGLDTSCGYVALDIDHARIRFINAFLSRAGREPLARCQDILTGPPDDCADLALMLKMSPSLERQESGSTLRLLDNLKVRYAVVSFSVKSLGGREKGMRAHYRRQFFDWTEGRHWSVAERLFENEMVFVVGTGVGSEV